MCECGSYAIRATEALGTHNTTTDSVDKNYAGEINLDS